MKDFEFETQGSYTYLVYKIKPEDVLDSMCLGMLTSNAGKIPGLITTSFTQLDEDKYIKYNVSSKIPASQIFSGVVNKARLIGVFDGILDAMIAAEDYMIDVDNILLDLEYIFVDSSTCETELVCLPIEGISNDVKDIGTFFKTIMFSTQFDQTENCDHVTKILNYLNSTAVFSIQAFEDLIEEIKSEKAAEPKITVKKVEEQPKVVTQTVNKQVSVPTGEVLEAQPKVAPVAPPAPVTPPTPVVSPVPVVPEKKDDKKEKKAKKEKVAKPESNENSDEKISLFHLLTNFDKETLEKYKAQKGDDSEKVAKPAKPAKAAAPANSSFAIPGKENKVVIPTAPNKAAAPSNTPVAAVEQPTVPEVNKEVVKKNYGATTVLNQENKPGATTVLDQSMLNSEYKPVPTLHREKNGDNITITNSSFTIGRDSSIVNYFIADNSAISKSHAVISIIDDKYYIKDTNSSNHVFVDGQQIAVSSNVEIKDGTKIRLANEDFTFLVR